MVLCRDEENIKVYVNGSSKKYLKANINKCSNSMIFNLQMKIESKIFKYVYTENIKTKQEILLQIINK